MLASVHSLVSLARPAVETQEAGALASRLPRGRLVELVGQRAGAQMSTAVACVRWAQEQGEPVAWVQVAGGPLYPPDLAACGVDLEALIVVQVPPGALPFGVPRAAELLLRSSGFGLVVVDLGDAALGDGRLRADTAWQGRLLGLSREHECSVILLSDAESRQHSLGPLISVCIEPRRQRTAPGRFTVEHHVRKDKSGLLGALRSEPRRGPWGLL
ncbi:MAG: DNA recombination/repair protein RecA [Myxococcales bacterium]|nr:DNA recombination/repair protein RecA [Myxococcales bacterium]